MLASSIANIFFDLQENHDGYDFVPQIDYLKLQGLIYQAHGFWLARHSYPLMQDRVQASDNGPIVIDIRNQFERFGNTPIFNYRATMLSPMHCLIPANEQINSEKYDFLSDIWNKFNHLSGTELNEAVCAEGDAWSMMINTYNGDLSSNPIIPNGLIKMIFEKRLND